MPRLLFIMRRRHSYGDYSQVLSSGLRNSVLFTIEMLHKLGVEAVWEECDDNNQIDRFIHIHKPTHCIVEAFWVVPEKFDVLKRLHPKVRFVVRNHSKTPFLACEGSAYSFIAGYLERGVEVMSNSRQAVSDLQVFSMEIGMATPTRPGWALPHSPVSLCSYGPNWYPIERALQIHHQHLGQGYRLQIGCFGACRPLKNHLVQATAAIHAASMMKCGLDFHINATRPEHGGDPILKNLESLFDALSSEFNLVEHPWLNHEHFLGLLSRMDLNLQVSMSETFNIVAADSIFVGIPILASYEIPWARTVVRTQDAEVISRKIVKLMQSPERRLRNVEANRFGLKSFCHHAEQEWSRWLGLE